MAETYIKPCPHCGGTGCLIGQYSYKLKSYMIFVRCDVCGAQGRIYNTDDEKDIENWNSDAAYCAISAWNLRTYHKLEAARKQLSHIEAKEKNTHE